MNGTNIGGNEAMIHHENKSDLPTPLDSWGEHGGSRNRMHANMNDVMVWTWMLWQSDAP